MDEELTMEEVSKLECQFESYFDVNNRKMKEHSTLLEEMNRLMDSNTKLLQQLLELVGVPKSHRLTRTSEAPFVEGVSPSILIEVKREEDGSYISDFEVSNSNLEIANNEDNVFDEMTDLKRNKEMIVEQVFDECPHIGENKFLKGFGFSDEFQPRCSNLEKVTERKIEENYDHYEKRASLSLKSRDDMDIFSNQNAHIEVCIPDKECLSEVTGVEIKDRDVRGKSEMISNQVEYGLVPSIATCNPHVSAFDILGVSKTARVMQLDEALISASRIGFQTYYPLLVAWLSKVFGIDNKYELSDECLSQDSIYQLQMIRNRKWFDTGQKMKVSNSSLLQMIRNSKWFDTGQIMKVSNSSLELSRCNMFIDVNLKCDGLDKALDVKFKHTKSFMTKEKPYYETWKCCDEKSLSHLWRKIISGLVSNALLFTGGWSQWIQVIQNIDVLSHPEISWRERVEVLPLECVAGTWISLIVGFEGLNMLKMLKGKGQVVRNRLIKNLCKSLGCSWRNLLSVKGFSNTFVYRLVVHNYYLDMSKAFDEVVHEGLELKVSNELSTKEPDDISYEQGICTSIRHLTENSQTPQKKLDPKISAHEDSSELDRDMNDEKAKNIVKVLTTKTPLLLECLACITFVDGEEPEVTEKSMQWMWYNVTIEAGCKLMYMLRCHCVIPKFGATIELGVVSLYKNVKSQVNLVQGIKIGVVYNHNMVLKFLQNEAVVQETFVWVVAANCLEVIIMLHFPIPVVYPLLFYKDESKLVSWLNSWRGYANATNIVLSVLLGYETVAEVLQEGKAPLVGIASRQTPVAQLIEDVLQNLTSPVSFVELGKELKVASDLICELQNAEANPNGSIKSITVGLRVSVEPNDQLILPSSFWHSNVYDFGSLLVKGKSQLPMGPNSIISAHPLFVQLLFDNCVPENVKDLLRETQLVKMKFVKMIIANQLNRNCVIGSIFVFDPGGWTINIITATRRASFFVVCMRLFFLGCELSYGLA